MYTCNYIYCSSTWQYWALHGPSTVVMRQLRVKRQSWVGFQCWIGLQEQGGGVRCQNVWKFAKGLKFRTDFHSKMSVCRHELGWTPNPPQFQPWLGSGAWSYVRMGSGSICDGIWNVVDPRKLNIAVHSTHSYLWCQWRGTRRGGRTDAAERRRRPKVFGCGRR